MSVRLSGIVAGALLGLYPTQEEDFQDPQEYSERMREIDHSFSSLEGQRHVHLAPDIEAEAETLIDLFGKVETFWKGRGDDDKARFARMAKDGAEKAREAALKNEQKAFEAAVETIAASCRGCHREPLDKYRLRTRQQR